jgi:hypothetical protein
VTLGAHDVCNCNTGAIDSEYHLLHGQYRTTLDLLFRTRNVNTNFINMQNMDSSAKRSYKHAGAVRHELQGVYAVPSAVSRPFRMSRYALADWNARLDAINKQVIYTSNGPNVILHDLYIPVCRPGLHFRSSSRTC